MAVNAQEVQPFQSFAASSIWGFRNKAGECSEGSNGLVVYLRNTRILIVCVFKDLWNAGIRANKFRCFSNIRPGYSGLSIKRVLRTRKGRRWQRVRAARASFSSGLANLGVFSSEKGHFFETHSARPGQQHTVAFASPEDGFFKKTKIPFLTQVSASNLPISSRKRALTQRARYPFHSVSFFR